MTEVVRARKSKMVIAVVSMIINVLLALNGLRVLSTLRDPSQQVLDLAETCAVMALVSVFAIIGGRRGWPRPLVIGLKYVPLIWAMFMCWMLFAIALMHGD